MTRVRPIDAKNRAWLFLCLRLLAAISLAVSCRRTYAMEGNNKFPGIDVDVATSRAVRSEETDFVCERQQALLICSCVNMPLEG